MQHTPRDQFARDAAARWHSGQHSPLFALAWTGAVPDAHAAVDEIEGALAYVRSGDGIFADAVAAHGAATELEWLRDYVLEHGTQAPARDRTPDEPVAA